MFPFAHIQHWGVTMPRETSAERWQQADRERQEHVQRIVGSKSRNRIVVAGPGTGKTYLFKTILREKTNTLTLSFVNALVNDLCEELFCLSDVKTLHGFARSVLRKAINGSVDIYPKLPAIIQSDSLILRNVDIKFGPLFECRVDDPENLAFYESRRNIYGRYGFTDIISAVVLFFEEDKNRIPSFSQIVVDEFQDFNPLEVSLIDLLAEKSPVLLAGDDDQALYETLKNASPAHIRARHGGATGDYEPFTLPYCSRCSEVIIKATNDIVAKAQERGLLQNRIPKEFSYFPCEKKDAISANYPAIVFAKLHYNQVAWYIDKAITDIKKGQQEKFDVLVICATGIQCKGVAERLIDKGFENVQYKARSEDSDPTLFDGLKLLLEERNCNLGWRIVSQSLLAAPEFDALLKNWDSDRQRLFDIIGTNLKSEVHRLLAILRDIRDQKDVSREDLEHLFGMTGFDALGSMQSTIHAELPPKKKSSDSCNPAVRRTPIQVTTYQSSKGLAADFVFIAHCDDRYSIRDKGGAIEDQDVCNMLVALTRARNCVHLIATNQDRLPTIVSWVNQHRMATNSGGRQH